MSTPKTPNSSRPLENRDEPFTLKNLEGISGVTFRIREDIKRLVMTALLGGALAGGTGVVARTAARSAVGYEGAVVTSTEKTDEPPAQPKEDAIKESPTQTEEQKAEPVRRRRIIDTDAVDEGENDEDKFAKYKKNQPTRQHSVEQNGRHLIDNMDDTIKQIKENVNPKIIIDSIESARKGVVNFVGDIEGNIKKAAHEAVLSAYSAVDPYIIPTVFFLTIFSYLSLARALVNFKKKTLSHHDQAMVQNLNAIAQEINHTRETERRVQELEALVTQLQAAQQTTPQATIDSLHRVAEATRALDLRIVRNTDEEK